MRTTSLLVLILAGALYCAGCQVTVDDLRPFELRQGGGESPRIQGQTQIRTHRGRGTVTALNHQS